jgi:hypothetical protein
MIRAILKPIEEGAGRGAVFAVIGADHLDSAALATIARALSAALEVRTSSYRAGESPNADTPSTDRCPP